MSKQVIDTEPIQNKYDFVVFFECINSNPNGDPDSGNMPRVDPFTNKGLVTDACIKRKIRNYVDLSYGNKAGYKMYIKGDSTLNEKDEEAFISVGCTSKDIAEYRKGNPEVDHLLRDFMTRNYFDIRTFGGVITKFANARLKTSSIRGPVQISMAGSVDEVEVNRLSIARTTVATAEERAKGGTTFGEKYFIPYGLYRFTGSISPTTAQRETGFSENDLCVLWEAILNMFEHDKSAARPDMRMRKLVVFKHDSIYGNIQAYKLTERVVAVAKKDGPTRCFEDYELVVDTVNLPSGVSCTVME